MGGFGDFTDICGIAPVPLCGAIEPDCYARNIELANTIIFSAAASAMHIVALVMTVIMILHVRGKFTAVGELNRVWRHREPRPGDGGYVGQQN